MRVAALADLHGRLDGVVVPPCDLVVIAGDLSPYAWKEAPNQVPWLEAFFAPWLERIAAEAGAPVVGIAGNRDFAWWWDRRVFERLPWTFLRDGGGDASAGCACTARPGARAGARGPRPTSRSRPRRRCRRARACRTGRRAVAAASSWRAGRTSWPTHFAAIPEDIDVLITHTPPQGHGDLHVDRRARRLAGAARGDRAHAAAARGLRAHPRGPRRADAGRRDAVRQLGDLRSLVRAAQPAVALRHRSRRPARPSSSPWVSEYSLGLLRCPGGDAPGRRSDTRAPAPQR